jgi:uncharacterized coiled-coil DUF342 family protein
VKLENAAQRLYNKFGANPCLTKKEKKLVDYINEKLPSDLSSAQQIGRIFL